MISVRRATREDAAALTRLWTFLQDAQGEFRALKMSRDPDQQFALELELIEEELWIVAERGGAIVGMAHLHDDRPSRVSDQAVLEMSRVCVDPAARGAGVGRALVNEATRIAKERGMPFVAAKVFAKNKPAMRFWEALDFDSFVDIKFRRVR